MIIKDGMESSAKGFLQDSKVKRLHSSPIAEEHNMYVTEIGPRHKDQLSSPTDRIRNSSGWLIIKCMNDVFLSLVMFHLLKMPKLPFTSVQVNSAAMLGR